MLSARLPRPHSLFSFLLALILALTVPANLLADGGRGNREAMADAMVRMMDAMGMFRDSGSDTWRSRSDRGYSTWRRPSSRFGGWPYGFPSRGSGWDPYGWSRQFPGAIPGYPMPYGAPSGFDGPGFGPYGYAEDPLLDFQGSWESPTGELLLIEGTRYRMYSGDLRYLDGLIDVDGDQLVLYNPELDNVRIFEYAYQDGRLLLRDETGQIYLYRRVFQNTSPLGRWR